MSRVLVRSQPSPQNRTTQAASIIGPLGQDANASTSIDGGRIDYRADRGRHRKRGPDPTEIHREQHCADDPFTEDEPQDDREGTGHRRTGEQCHPPGAEQCPQSARQNACGADGEEIGGEAEVPAEEQHRADADYFDRQRVADGEYRDDGKFCAENSVTAASCEERRGESFVAEFGSGGECSEDSREHQDKRVGDTEADAGGHDIDVEGGVSRIGHDFDERPSRGSNQHGHDDRCDGQCPPVAQGENFECLRAHERGHRCLRKVRMRQGRNSPVRNRDRVGGGIRPGGTAYCGVVIARNSCSRSAPSVATPKIVTPAADATGGSTDVSVPPTASRPSCVIWRR